MHPNTMATPLAVLLLASNCCCCFRATSKQPADAVHSPTAPNTLLLLLSLLLVAARADFCGDKQGTNLCS